jgi:hypothetical protein
MYLGFYLNNSEDEDERDLIGLETTVIGAPEIDEPESDLPEALDKLGDEISDKARNSKAWKSFVSAVVTGTDDLDKNADKFDAGDPDWQIIDIGQARDEGIMPISYEAPSH